MNTHKKKKHEKIVLYIKIQNYYIQSDEKHHDKIINSGINLKLQNDTTWLRRNSFLFGVVKNS